MTTYTVPNPETAEGLTNIGPAGKSFLVCRGIAGGLPEMEDAHPHNVDRVAMMIWMGWLGDDGQETPEAVAQATEKAAEMDTERESGDDWDSYTPAPADDCHECGGAGRVLAGERCEGCQGSGKAPQADTYMGREIVSYLEMCHEREAREAALPPRYRTGRES
jgi:hypothetical protein